MARTGAGGGGGVGGVAVADALNSLDRTTITLDLPDDLAEDARESGLLSTDSLTALLREKLNSKRIDELFEAMDRMAAIEDPAPMAPEEVAAEIAAMRAERRAALAA